MRRYEQYKDSGVEWIGEIPVGWEVKRIKFVLNERKAVANNENLDLLSVSEYYGVAKRKNKIAAGDILIKAKSTERYRVVEKSDLVINIMLAWKKGLGVSEYRGMTSPAYCVYNINDNYEPKYIHYLFRTDLYADYFKANSTGIIDSRLRLYSESLYNIDAILPPLPEQTAIANYLDQKTAEIDTLIADKQRLLDLYEEEKTAVINQAVTKGLNPDAPMQDSGIEWLGDVPVGWAVKKLKYIIKEFESGVSVNSIDTPIVDGEFGILKTSCVYTLTFRPEENKVILNNTELNRARTTPRKGMIIISRMNTPELVGASGYVHKDYTNLYLPDRLWQTIFYKNVELNTKWLSFLFISSKFRKVIASLAAGTSSSMKNIGQESFLAVKIPYPDLKEQSYIVHHIEAETTRLDAKIERTQRLIALLAEYRVALISEVVTGQVKVV